MNADEVAVLGDELYAALRARRTVAPLTVARCPEITIDDAYRISLAMLERRLARRREGHREEDRRHEQGRCRTCSTCTSRTSATSPTAWRYETPAEMPIGRELIQPRAEGEIAFVLEARSAWARGHAGGRARRDRVRDGRASRSSTRASKTGRSRFAGHRRRQRLERALRARHGAGGPDAGRFRDLRHGRGEERRGHQHRSGGRRARIAARVRGLAGEHARALRDRRSRRAR